MEDTLGEFQLGVLAQVGRQGSRRRRPRRPPRAGAGTAWPWSTNGDRAGVVIDTRWDSPAEATEFAAAAQTALDAIGGHHALIAIDGTDRVTLFIATDDATISALASALGLAG